MSGGGKQRAVVAGAGLGGLAVALRLAARGWEVTVCEQGDSPGGKMNCWETSGYRFDTGPSLLTMPWVFEELFSACGTRFEDHLEWIGVHPMAEYVFDDGTRFSQGANLPAWLETVRRLEGGDASGYLRFMALAARLFELSKATFFHRSPFEPPDPSSWRALRHLPLRRGWGRYHATLKRFFRSPHLRQLYDRYITYVGSSPYQAPATLFVIPFVETAFGGWHIRGGLYRLIETLVRLGRERNVDLRLGARVRTIRLEDGRARGVELENGPPIEADIVVLNGDASRTPALLGRANGHGIAESERSTSGLMFLLALRKTLADQPHHSVFFSADYATEFHQLFDQRRFPDDPTVYVNRPGYSDRSMMPAGGDTLFIMANAPANDHDAWDEPMIADARRRVMARLQRAGFPAIENDIVAQSVWTPRRLATRYDMPGGAIYGQVSHGWRRTFMRPPNRYRNVPGLYHVGGSTHPGGGTPTVLLSADITARLIERYEEI